MINKLIYNIKCAWLDFCMRGFEKDARRKLAEAEAAKGHLETLRKSKTSINGDES